MRSRLVTPGLAASSARISLPVSVTARAIFLRIAAGSSSTSMMPAADDEDLLIFAVGSCRSVILATPAEDVGGRDGERVPVAVVEPHREVPAELQVLPLVLADRHLVGLVEQDVGGLQHRVAEQPEAGLLGAALGRLVLELGHPAQLAEPGQAAEHPGQLGVLRHVALHEHHAAVRVEPGREQLGGGHPGPLPQPGRVLRHGDRVQVHHAVERLVRLLERHPLAQRAQVVAEVEGVGGRLDAGEHAWPGHAASLIRGDDPPGPPGITGSARPSSVGPPLPGQ